MKISLLASVALALSTAIAAPTPIRNAKAGSPTAGQWNKRNDNKIVKASDAETIVNKKATSAAERDKHGADAVLNRKPGSARKRQLQSLATEQTVQAVEGLPGAFETVDGRNGAETANLLGEAMSPFFHDLASGTATGLGGTGSVTKRQQQSSAQVPGAVQGIFGEFGLTRNLVGSIGANGFRGTGSATKRQSQQFTSLEDTAQQVRNAFADGAGAGDVDADAVSESASSSEAGPFIGNPVSDAASRSASSSDAEGPTGATAGNDGNEVSESASSSEAAPFIAEAVSDASNSVGGVVSGVGNLVGSATSSLSFSA